MKIFKLLILLFVSVFVFVGVSAQDPSLNIVLGSSGVVNVGGTIFLQIDVTNNSASGTIVANKVRPQISVPANISFIPVSGHNLPAGWTITSNNGSVIRITNTTDPIPAGTTRTAFIAVEGTADGGGSILGNLTFNGPAPSGDNTANNTSSAGLTVTNTTPVTLTNFNASLVNCQPVLNWITETEINSDRFEIERGSTDNSNWKLMGTVTAKGNSNAKAIYNFIDKNLPVTSAKVLYRLKMIDRDGAYKYSKILPVFINCKTTQVYAYPNPVKNGRLYVSLTGANGYAEATLTAMSGQVVLKSKISNGTSDLNTSTIAPGEYILTIKDANGYDKKIKVLIQH